MATQQRELSDREKQILALVNEGLSNREIADRLVVTVNTVETHIGRILRKLDVRSRWQAADHWRAKFADAGTDGRTSNP